MPKTKLEPTVVQDIRTLADLYVDVFRLMRRRTDPGSRREYPLPFERAEGEPEARQSVGHRAPEPLGLHRRRQLVR